MRHIGFKICGCVSVCSHQQLVCSDRVFGARSHDYFVGRSAPHRGSFNDGTNAHPSESDLVLFQVPVSNEFIAYTGDGIEIKTIACALWFYRATHKCIAVCIIHDNCALHPFNSDIMKNMAIHRIGCIAADLFIKHQSKPAALSISDIWNSTTELAAVPKRLVIPIPFRVSCSFGAYPDLGVIVMYAAEKYFVVLASFGSTSAF